jgi:hypothetical protein
VCKEGVRGQARASCAGDGSIGRLDGLGRMAEGCGAESDALQNGMMQLYVAYAHSRPLPSPQIPVSDTSHNNLMLACAAVRSDAALLCLSIGPSGDGCCAAGERRQCGGKDECEHCARLFLSLLLTHMQNEHGYL